MKSKKGQFGYVQSQRRIRVLRTILFFAVAFGVFGIGLALNGGDRRNIYTVVAAVGAIPGAMSLVSTIMIFRCPVMDRALYEEISSRTGELRTLYELYLTTENTNLFLDAVIVCGEYIVAYTSSGASAGTIAFMEKHIRRSTTAAAFRCTVKIFDSKAKFLERADQLREKREQFEMERDPEVAQILKDISL